MFTDYLWVHCCLSNQQIIFLWFYFACLVCICFLIANVSDHRLSAEHVWFLDASLNVTVGLAPAARQLVCVLLVVWTGGYPKPAASM